MTTCKSFLSSSMYVYIGFKMFFYFVRHLDSWPSFRFISFMAFFIPSKDLMYKISVFLPLLTNKINKNNNNNNNNNSYVGLEMYAVWMQDLLVMGRIACGMSRLHSSNCKGRFKTSCRPHGGRHAAKHAMSAAWEFFISACKRKELKNCTKITIESRKFPY